MTDESNSLLDTASLEAIAEIATSSEDAEAAFATVGIKFEHERVQGGPGVIFVPGVQSHVRRTLQSLDLGDPNDVVRILRALPTMIELYQASKKDERKLVRLRMALEADGFHIGRTDNLSAALVDLAVTAADALKDMTGI